MSKIIGAVPNICEGRNKEVVDEILGKVHACGDAKVLDVSRDTSRNRSVISFAGSAEALFNCGMILYEETLKRIDMREHEGSYPRIGAVDVFPFVPLKDTTIEETVDLSLRFAEEVAERFDLPVYLFEESARRPSRRDIENIRAGQYEGLSAKLQDPQWEPDFGPMEFKPESGATIIGARYPLVSFKVLLSTNDEVVSEQIVSAVSTLSHVHIYSGVDGRTKRRDMTVSITNYRENPMYRVLEAIRTEGRRYGVHINRVEMIGLIPEIAFIESALYYMGIRNFPTSHLLEKSIEEHMKEYMPLK